LIGAVLRRSLRWTELPLRKWRAGHAKENFGYAQEVTSLARQGALQIAQIWSF
jgi:hypothetical protein